MPRPVLDEVEKVRLPAAGEVLGIVEQMFGFDRVRVRCKDGYTRNCRIRGKIRKRMWVREGDVVLVQPWPVQATERGDLIYRYTSTQVEWLKRKGIWD